MAKPKIENWEKIDSREVVDCNILRVRRDRSRSPRTGAVHDVHILEMPDWINVVPVTPEGKVVLIRQFRHGMEETKLEIPGGAVEVGEANPMEAARRDSRIPRFGSPESGNTKQPVFQFSSDGCGAGGRAAA